VICKHYDLPYANLTCGYCAKTYRGCPKCAGALCAECAKVKAAYSAYLSRWYTRRAKPQKLTEDEFKKLYTELDTCENRRDYEMAMYDAALPVGIARRIKQLRRTLLLRAA
jgi:hypothetical protein